MRIVNFASLKIGSAFSPAPGNYGATSVYVKRENFICPKVGEDGHEGIFWPEDRVIETKLPEKIRRHYA